MDIVQKARLVLRTRASALVAISVATIGSLPAHASDDLELLPDFFFVSPVLVIVFIALILPLNALIFQPLFRVLDARDNKISGARQRAVQVEAQAAEALARYETSVRAAREDALADRRSHIEAARADLVAATRRAKEQAEGDLEHAREELKSSLAESRETLRGGTQELAQLAAERILGRELS